MKKTINPLRSQRLFVSVSSDNNKPVMYEANFAKPFNSYHLKDLIADVMQEVPKGREKYRIVIEIVK